MLVPIVERASGHATSCSQESRARSAITRSRLRLQAPRSDRARSGTARRPVSGLHRGLQRRMRRAVRRSKPRTTGSSAGTFTLRSIPPKSRPSPSSSSRNVFRRDLEKQLTEAVIKEINLRTPYRVVGNHAEADSLLTGTITSADKNLVVEAPTNLPRELNATITVQVNWTHNPPTEIESNADPDHRLRDDQLRPRSRRDDA